MAIASPPAPGSLETARVVASPRLLNLDRLRVVAIAAIVLFHISSGHDGAMLWGLAAFLVLSCALSVRSARPKPTGRFVAERARRLLVPWLFWCLIYGIYQLLAALKHGTPLGDAFQPTMLLYGTYIHLWFLPFIFAAGVAVHGLHRLTQRWPTKAVALASLAAGVATAAAVTRIDGRWPAPFEQWWFSMPAVLVGFGVGRAMSLTEARTWQRRVWGTLAGVMLPLAIVLYWRWSPTPLADEVLTLALISLAMLFPGGTSRSAAQGAGFHWPEATRRLLPLLYGIYLVHPLVIFRSYGWWNLHEHQWLWLAVVLAISATIVAAMRATPLRRFV